VNLTVGGELITAELVQTQLIILGLLGETGLSAQCNVGVMEPKNDLGIATHPVMEAIPAHLRCNLMTKRVTMDHAPLMEAGVIGVNGATAQFHAGVEKIPELGPVTVLHLNMVVQNV